MDQNKEMMAISLTQPWATLVAIGAKRIETRSWQTSYRGPLAIHASKGFPGWAKRIMLMEQPFPRVLGEAFNYNWTPPVEAARGCIIATCELVGIVSTQQMTNGGTWWDGPDGRRYEFRLSEQERAFGDYAPRRWAWLLDDIQALPKPIPARGSLGLWRWKQ